MLLQNIMFWWACLALLIAIVAMGGLLTRKGVDKDTGQTPKSFLDFSAGQLEGREMQKVLSDALSGAGTDAEFEQHYKVAIEVVTGLEAETSWAWLGRFLMEYRQANEFEASPRQLAARFLADIPRRYNLKDVSPATPAA